MDINPLTDGSEGPRFTSSSAKLYGFINAYNMQTGELAWSHETPHECYGGFLATAGELLFTVNATGQFIAYNAKTGAQVWEFGAENNYGKGCVHEGTPGATKAAGLNPANPAAEVATEVNKHGETVWCHDQAAEKAPTGSHVSEPLTPTLENSENFTFGNPGLGAGGAAPAISFEFEGKQYIVVYAGGGTLGSLTAGDYLWEFSLGGSGAALPIKEGEGPLPETELCSAYLTLKAEHKNCEGY
jgi:hypothetical protein